MCRDSWSAWDGQREGQRRAPATRGVRIATRRVGWRPFAGPSGSAISLLNQLSCRQARSQTSGIHIYPVNLQPLNSQDKMPRPLPSKQCLSLADALSCCLNDLTVTICQTRQWSVIEEDLRCCHRIPSALLLSSHCHLCELRKPSDNQQMFTCDRAHRHYAERQGQRRGPAAGRARIATRRAGWLPFAGPTGWPPNEGDLAARNAEHARTEPAPHR